MNDYETEAEAISAAKRECDYHISFDGHNCNDIDNNCAGWDGQSNRCDCGNRRVYWSVNKTDEGRFYAYAEAY